MESKRETTVGGVFRYGMLGALIIMVFQEIANFFGVGGFESRIGFSLLKIQIYLFLINFFYKNELHWDLEKIMEALKALLHDYFRRSEEKKTNNINLILF